MNLPESVVPAENAAAESNLNPNDEKESSESPLQNKGRQFQSPGTIAAKFRHLNGTIYPKETHITDLVSLTKTMPGESNSFAANEKKVALAIGAGGTFLAILELSKAGRVPAISDLPGIVIKNSAMDFCWDPFDCSRLAVGDENGNLQIWDIPDGLSEKLEVPNVILQSHSKRITILMFHMCAKDIVASASSDLSICITDIASQRVVFRLTGHTNQILCLAWNYAGTHLASVSKDLKVRVFNPRLSSEPQKEGFGPKGLRGARAVWVLNGTFLAVSGFSKISERQVYLYDCNDISHPVEDISLDVSPATLVPYYDEDSSVLFLSGKGDATIFAYGVSAKPPHFLPLSHYKCPTPHQAISFLPKCVCDVKKVEFARAVRLTTTSIQMISFHVPRLREEYFQDDLFPPALETWAPLMSSSEWIAGIDKPFKRVDLKPSSMELLSEAPSPPKVEPKVGECGDFIIDGDVNMMSSLAFLLNSKEKEEQLVKSMMSKCQLQTTDLPQEEVEGVDPSEWDDY